MVMDTSIIIGFNQISSAVHLLKLLVQGFLIKFRNVVDFTNSSFCIYLFASNCWEMIILWGITVDEAFN